MLLNTTIILIAYGLTLWAFCSSVRKGQFPQIPPSRKNLSKITCKLLFLYALLWLFCWYFDINTLTVIMVIAGIALFTFCFFELAAPVLVVGYILLQWILGFPDKELWIPSNRPYNPKSDISDTLISKIATTQTPLRPTGYILIKNKEYLAKSEINFIDKNTPVEITAISNGTIIVDLSKKMES